MSAMKQEKKKEANVPNLRFPEFTGEWEKKKLGKIAEIVGGGTPDTGVPEYWNGKIQWFTPSEIKSNYVGKSERTITKLGLQKSSAKLLPIGTILLTTRATIGEASIATEECSTNQGFQSLVVNKEADNIFVLNWIKQNKNEFIRRANGSTFAEINKLEIKEIPIFIPKYLEQNKISAFLSLIDKRIETQNKIIEDLKLLKSTIRNQLFGALKEVSQKMCVIRDVLNYEQPTKYIVGSDDYHNDSTLIPVLTANKAFILGYTAEKYGIYDKGPCIIFDDFTMDMKYVDFPFKVKSSAIKILTPKPDMNLKYVFEYLSFLSLTSSDHKRHYISEVESIPIYISEVYTQNRFSNLFSALDKKIEFELHYYDLLLSQKNYLLHQLFL